MNGMGREQYPTRSAGRLGAIIRREIGMSKRQDLMSRGILLTHVDGLFRLQ
jgi:hypothetical protein